MSDHPYKHLPDRAFWRRAVAQVPPSEVNPAITSSFAISPTDAVMTAGSCFAQYIGPMLRRLGFNYLVTEPAHALFPPELATEFGYGMFTARTGNIYTARQLLQLFHRTYGNFQPAEDVWVEGACFIDPFRPQIQPGGFLSRREFTLDREKHLTAVRRAFETLDVLVFTLGLTEAWALKLDDAVFPLCPGVAGGQFDPARYEFHNFSVSEVVADMTAFIDGLRDKNPKCRIILTVSPVPLVATARVDTHVLAATVYSKSILRVAAEMVAQARSLVAYFPSYEIITARYDAGTYFAADRRAVLPEGVAHVMRAFAGCFTNIFAPLPLQVQEGAAHMREIEALIQAQCDEIALGPE